LAPSTQHPWYVQPAGKPVADGVEIETDVDDPVAVPVAEVEVGVTVPLRT
jgi:hypothetical protein